MTRTVHQAPADAMLWVAYEPWIDGAFGPFEPARLRVLAACVDTDTDGSRAIQVAVEPGPHPAPGAGARGATLVGRQQVFQDEAPCIERCAALNRAFGRTPRLAEGRAA